MKLEDDQVRYIDRPEILETFVDSIGAGSFQHGVARIEMCVTRMDKLEQGDKPTARRYPVARAVLTPQAILDLFQQLQGMVIIMQKEGVIKTQPVSQQPPGKH